MTQPRYPIIFVDDWNNLKILDRVSLSHLKYSLLQEDHALSVAEQQNRTNESCAFNFNIRIRMVGNCQTVGIG
jgi:hypothetical protein